MDPEPGRCRRTDGKKWRCSRDVVVGQKYCERHMHRGRNRSRKPVEIPTSGGGGEAVKLSAAAAPPRFSLSGSYTSMDLLHQNQRGEVETKSTFEGQNEGQTAGGDRTLRHFFDDWPRSLDESENAAAKNLSISTSDFSLKLGSSNGDEGVARERPWGMAWETSRVGPMGGPLAEALRSSVSSSSPTSVLHRLQRSSAWEASFVSS